MTRQEKIEDKIKNYNTKKTNYKHLKKRMSLQRAAWVKLVLADWCWTALVDSIRPCTDRSRSLTELGVWRL